MTCKPSLKEISSGPLGTGYGPVIVVAAYLDTVFPAGNSANVIRRGNTLRGPGVGDDPASLPAPSAIIQVMDAAHFRTEADVLFIGDVREVGPGS